MSEFNYGDIVKLEGIYYRNTDDNKFAIIETGKRFYTVALQDLTLVNVALKPKVKKWKYLMHYALDQKFYVTEKYYKNERDALEAYTDYRGNNFYSLIQRLDNTEVEFEE